MNVHVYCYIWRPSFTDQDLQASISKFSRKKSSWSQISAASFAYEEKQESKCRLSGCVSGLGEDRFLLGCHIVCFFSSLLWFRCGFQASLWQWFWVRCARPVFQHWISPSSLQILVYWTNIGTQKEKRLWSIW